MDENVLNPSRTLGVLKGKIIEGISNSPVKDIQVAGAHRILIFADGGVRRVPVEMLKNILYGAITKEQLKKSMQSIKKNKDGTATAKVGGQLRKYSTPKRAASYVEKYFRP